MTYTKPPKSSVQKVLNIWAVILIIWSLYRVQFRTDLPPWFDEFIAKPLVFIVPVWYYITKIEKKNFLQAIQLKFANLVPAILLSVGIGALFFISGGLGTILKNKSIDSVFHLIPLSVLGYYLLLSLATSISEEVLIRGFVLKNLYDDSKNVLTAAFFTSILFFFLHVPILFTSEKIIGVVLIRVMFTDLLLSLATSFIYIERRNLLIPILIHAFYNLSLYLLM